ncbi:HNH endonuclease [Glutamicibacter arilaitensis]|uniref:HNH endonuclease n=1 Tax=Glutamicibacter arilaitensis TaxID=256701 RepID=UPI003FD35522
MVHKVPTARIRFDKGFWGTSGKLVLTLGKKDYLLRKVARAEYDHLLSRQLEQPKVLARVKGKNYWLFKNNIYSDLDDLKASQIYAVLEASRLRRQRKVENAVALQDLKHQPAVRRGIPDEVKLLVMQRDGGQCSHCGASSELQYDHIIPISRGGSSNAENLQILCGPCNRAKGANLTVRRLG